MKRFLDSPSNPSRRCMSALVPNVAVTSAWGLPQDSRFDPDFADFVEGTSVRTALLIDHLLAEDALAQGFVVLLELLLGLLVVFRNGGLEFFLDVLNQCVAFRFGVFLGIESVDELGADLAPQIVVVRVIELRRLDLTLGLAYFLPQLADRLADLLDLGVAELDRVDD